MADVMTLSLLIPMAILGFVALAGIWCGLSCCDGDSSFRLKSSLGFVVKVSSNPVGPASGVRARTVVMGGGVVSSVFGVELPVEVGAGGMENVVVGAE